MTGLRGRTWPAAGWLLAAALPVCAPVHAQDESATDPYQTDPHQTDPYQTDPLAADAFEIADTPVPDWRVAADLLLRADHVEGLPGGRADLDRLRSRLRAGLAYADARGLVGGIGLSAALGSDANADNLRNNDNQRSDRLALDHAWIGGDGERLQWRLGKRAPGLELTPLVWDADLRPVGAELAFAHAGTGRQRLSLRAGAWELDHPLGGDPRIAAVQGGWQWNAGGRTSATVLLGWIDFGGLRSLAQAGLGRGNRLHQGRFVHDFRLLDLQLSVRRQLSRAALELRLDLVRNLGASDARDAVRASAVYGDRRVPGQWEFGYAFQRAQADSVLASVTEDDWWFHSGARGHMPWVGVGLSGSWSLRVAGFFERRDGLADRTRRLLVDVEARW